MWFKYVLSASEIFITFQMQLAHLLGVYSIFLYCCKGNKWEMSLSGLAQTDLLRTAMVQYVQKWRLLSRAQITPWTSEGRLVL